MSSKTEISIKCPSCGRVHQTTVYHSIWGESAENKRLVYNDEINVYSCPSCKNKIPIVTTLFYNNAPKGIGAWYDPKNDTSNIENSNKTWSSLLGKNAKYMIEAPKFKEWEDFKFYIQQKEGDLSIKIPQSDSPKRLDSVTSYFFKYLHIEKIGQCPKCHQSDIPLALRMVCNDCNIPVPTKNIPRLFVVSLKIMEFFLLNLDEFMGSRQKLDLIQLLQDTSNNTLRSDSIPPNKELKSLKDALFSIKKVGGNKVGGEIQFSGDSHPQIRLQSQNGLILESAPYNLSYFILAFDYARLIEPKKRKWLF